MLNKLDKFRYKFDFLGSTYYIIATTVEEAVTRLSYSISNRTGINYDFVKSHLVFKSKIFKSYGETRDTAANRRKLNTIYKELFIEDAIKNEESLR
jgi:hypothetical protein